MAAVEDPDFDETRAHARLPQMEIEIVRRAARDSDRESVTVTVELVPFPMLSFPQGLERLIALSDPFRFWGQMIEAAWQPWLQALSAFAPQATTARALPPVKEE
ncbi:MAG: hypothetical protein R3D05_15450 [Dongiaceae bacterium]